MVYSYTYGKKNDRRGKEKEIALAENPKTALRKTRDAREKSRKTAKVKRTNATQKTLTLYTSGRPYIKLAFFVYSIEYPYLVSI
ncbi:MAG: hypothetical protein HYT29_01225 [Parcubacteria group bacterium]|nr:hypothetical protein [Parcubacteria group bacterium]